MPSALTVEELAYAAGFFDGEGNITIAYTKANPSKPAKAKYARYTLHVTASQVRPAIIHWFVEKFGGRAYHCVARRSYNDTYYDRWDWKVYTAQGADFLKKIRPYLIVKAEEADIALAFQESMDRRSNSRGGSRGHGGSVGPEVLKFRQACLEQIRQIRKPVIDAKFNT